MRQVAWLGLPGPAGRFGRGLALAGIATSIAGNGLGHALAAFGVAPAWWVVVLVSSVPPAVLGAMVHLALLAGRAVEQDGGEDERGDEQDDRAVTRLRPASSAGTALGGRSSAPGRRARDPAGAGSTAVA